MTQRASRRAPSGAGHRAKTSRATPSTSESEERSSKQTDPLPHRIDSITGRAEKRIQPLSDADSVLDTRVVHLALEVIRCNHLLDLRRSVLALGALRACDFS